MAIHMKMILLSLVMLLIAFEPAFSGKILKKLDKELKKMGLRKLQNFLADIDENAVEIVNNAVNIGDVENDVVSQGSRLLDLETMGSGSVWFDAIRDSNFYAAGSYGTITYSSIREASSYLGALNTGTGIFTAPLAGTYQFLLQVYKASGVPGQVSILLDGQTISYIQDRLDLANSATITGTAIVKLQPGQKVWAESAYNLWAADGRNHFTGVLITPE